MFKSSHKATDKKTLSQKGNEAEQNSEGVYSQAKATQGLSQIQLMADQSAKQSRTTRQQTEQNKTGIPDDLKYGIENLSGQSLKDVRVKYNSPKPASLQAKAFAQGSEIHIGSGHENTLPHEAWHIAQQKQGRVQSTTQLKGSTNINDNKSLEKEADIMGSKAQSLGFNTPPSALKSVVTSSSIPAQRVQGEEKENFVKNQVKIIEGKITSQKQVDSGPQDAAEKPIAKDKIEAAAATRIQALSRGKAVRSRAKEEREAATRIQALSRGKAGRSIAKEEREAAKAAAAAAAKKQQEETEAAATTRIQALRRGKAGRSRAKEEREAAKAAAAAAAKKQQEEQKFRRDAQDKFNEQYGGKGEGPSAPEETLDTASESIGSSETFTGLGDQGIEDYVGLSGSSAAAVSNKSDASENENHSNSKTDNGSDDGFRIGGGITSGLSTLLNMFKSGQDLEFAMSRDRKERMTKDEKGNDKISLSKVGSTLSRGASNSTKFALSVASNVKEGAKTIGSHFKNGAHVAKQAGGVMAGFQAASGVLDVLNGVNEVRKARTRKKGIDDEILNNNSTPDKAEGLKLMQEHQKKSRNRGIFKASTGVLDAAAGFSALGGAVPIAAGLASTSAGIKALNASKKKITEIGREGAARRIRTKEQIAQDALIKQLRYDKYANNHENRVQELEGQAPADGSGFFGKMYHRISTPVRYMQKIYHQNMGTRNKRLLEEHKQKIGGTGEREDFENYADRKINKYKDKGWSLQGFKNSFYGRREEDSGGTKPKLAEARLFNFNTEKTKEKKKENLDKLTNFLLNNDGYRQQMIGKDSLYFIDLTDDVAKKEIIKEKLTGDKHHNRSAYKQRNQNQGGVP